MGKLPLTSLGFWIRALQRDNFLKEKLADLCTNIPLELNLIITLKGLYFLHFIMDLVKDSVLLPFYCKYLNTCTILSLSLFFFKFPCSGYIAQRDQNRTGINVSLLKEEREIFFWLLLYFSVHCYTSLSLLLMINFIMNCKTLVWHCWPNFWSTILCCIGSRSHEITTSFSRYGLEV